MTRTATPRPVRAASAAVRARPQLLLPRRRMARSRGRSSRSGEARWWVAGSSPGRLSGTQHSRYMYAKVTHQSERALAED